MPTIWAYEVGYILTGAHFLLAMAFTLKSDEHIRIDIFSGQFSQRTRAVIDLLAYAVLLPLMIWLSYALFQHLRAGLPAQRAERPVGDEPAGVALPRDLLVAFTLLTLQILAEVIKAVRRFRAPQRAA